MYFPWHGQCNWSSGQGRPRADNRLEHGVKGLLGRQHEPMRHSHSVNKHVLTDLSCLTESKFRATVMYKMKELGDRFSRSFSHEQIKVTCLSGPMCLIMTYQTLDQTSMQLWCLSGHCQRKKTIHWSMSTRGKFPSIFMRIFCGIPGIPLI